MHRHLATVFGIFLLALVSLGTAHAEGGLKNFEFCTDNGACNSGRCADKRCIPAGGLDNGRVCSKSADCSSNTCAASAPGSAFKVCGAAKHVTGELCDKDAECQSNECSGRFFNSVCTQGKLGPGAVCTTNSDCMFGSCAVVAGSGNIKICLLPGAAAKSNDLERCETDAQCTSGVCGFESGLRTRKRCIPKNGLALGSACAEARNCMPVSSPNGPGKFGYCDSVGPAKDRACVVPAKK